jgi:hypothetical protein
MNNSTQFWDDLLHYMQKGEVIPILGQDLLTVEYAGRSVNAYRLLAELLAKELQIPENRLPPNFTLSQVVAAYPRFLAKRKEIYWLIHAIFQSLQVQIPDSLRLLAGIPAFQLFVTTTFDPWMEAALAERHRDSGHHPRSIAYSGGTKVEDLEVGQLGLTEPIVYQLFGRICPHPYYAVTEEDLLEFLHKLQARPPKYLCDILAERHLLFIGNAFSDWLARFFVRTVRGKPFSQQGTEVFFVDNELRQSESLQSFFQGFCWESNILPENTPVDFVNSLHEVWFQRYSSPQPDPRPPDRTEDDQASHSLFISYNHADQEPVLRLEDKLRQAGFNCWVDWRSEDLQAGEEYERKIERKIRKCTLFVPILSHGAEHRLEGYFRREWSLALRRLPDFTGADRPFLFPVVVDDLQLDVCRNIPEEFKRVQVLQAPKGVLPDNGVTRLREIIRELVRRET